MLNDENKKHFKEILMKDKKMSEEEIDKILNMNFINDYDNSNFWIIGLLIIALFSNQPKEVVIPPINININYGDEE